jgi:hypothetical protein
MYNVKYANFVPHKPHNINHKYGAGGGEVESIRIVSVSGGE